MKVFINVKAFFEGTGKPAVKPFVFDINKEEDEITVAEVKTAAREQFKRIEFSENMVSEKVSFAGTDSHEDTVEIISIAGKCPKIDYIISVPAQVNQQANTSPRAIRKD